MTVDPAPDGWFIEYNGRYYHVNQKWLDEMFRHQVKPYGDNPAFHRLQYAFAQGATATQIETLFIDFIDHRGHRPEPNPAAVNAPVAPEAEFHRFIADQQKRKN